MFITKSGLTAFLLIFGVALPASVSASELSNGFLELKVPPLAPDPIPGRGVSPSPIEPRLLNQAESNYQAGRYVHAIEQFGMVAAMNNHPFAWLRIGNIWHRRGNAAMALDAYRRASDLSATSEQHKKLWSRAMMNMTLLGIDQARQAVVALGPAQKENASAQWASEIRLRVQELQRALPGGLPTNFDQAEQAPVVTPKGKKARTQSKRRTKKKMRRTQKKVQRSKSIARVKSE